MDDPRQTAIREMFSLLRELIKDRSWYDFGCGFGLSSRLLYEFGAREVVGFEPDVSRIESCPAGMLVTTTDDIKSFDNAIACGVFEHIYPEDRKRTLRSLWDRLKPGGHLIIADTPNSLLPYDPHTTGLMLIPWLPERLARAWAEYRIKPWWEDWRSCGWRGLWYGDFASLHGKVNVSPISRPRHARLAALGLHPHLLDPWPLWVWRKDS